MNQLELFPESKEAPEKTFTTAYQIKSVKSKKSGKYIETIMFADYNWLQATLRKLQRKNVGRKNPFFDRLVWLLARGENRKVKMTCPHCQQNLVEYFSALGNYQYGYSINASYVCCGKKECREAVMNMAQEKIPQFFPIKFSSLQYFHRKTEQKQIIKLFKQLFSLPQRLGYKKAFEFFLA